MRRRAHTPFLVVAAIVGAAEQARADASCPIAGQTSVTIAGVEPRLELRLTDGRLIRLAGLDPALQTPDAPDLAETTRITLAAKIAGKRVALVTLADSADRWGRIPAIAFAADETGAPGGLATTAIALGLGRYLAEAAAHACRDAFIKAEHQARGAKLGLWRDPYYAVLAVDDRAGFSERSGTIVLAEGQLTTVQPSLYRTTLRFSASDHDTQVGSRLVATIPPRVMKTFAAQRVDVESLIGQRLRFRGLLDLRFGPRVELTTPDEIEPVPDSDATAPPPG